MSVNRLIETRITTGDVQSTTSSNQAAGGRFVVATATSESATRSQVPSGIL